MRILLAEDNILFGDAVCDHLRSTGWVVTWAKGYKAALEALHNGEFDILCLDRQLGDGDGFDILRCKAPACPTIVMSAFDRLTDRLEAKRLGAADYLVKPFGMQQLTHRICLVLPQAPAGCQTAPNVLRS